MNLVVAGDTLPLRVVNQRAVEHPVRRRRPTHNAFGQGERYRASHDPQAQIAGGIGQKLLDRPIAVHLLNREFVRVMQAQQAKILGQYRQFGTRLSHLAQQSAGLGQIALQV